MKAGRWGALALSLWLAVPAAGQPIARPDAQARFEAMLVDLKSRSQAAPNDVARSNLRRERARRTHTEGMNAPAGWVANVVAIRADPQGNAVVVLNLNGHGLVTNVAEVEGQKRGVAIAPGTPLHAAVANLRAMQMVRFDGGWLCMGTARAMDDCPADGQATHRGALEQPIMLISFRRIAPID